MRGFLDPLKRIITVDKEHEERSLPLCYKLFKADDSSINHLPQL